MSVLPRFRIHVRITKLLKRSLMATSSDKVYYAVGRGKVTGIFDTWKECKAQTDGFCGAKYRKFYTLEEAEEFVNFWKGYSSPKYESVESKNIVSKALYQEENITSGKGTNKVMENWICIKTCTLINSVKCYKPISASTLGHELNMQFSKMSASATSYSLSLPNIIISSLTNPITTKKNKKLRNSEEAIIMKEPINVLSWHCQTFSFNYSVGDYIEQNLKFLKDSQEQCKPGILSIILDIYLNFLPSFKLLTVLAQNILNRTKLNDTGLVIQNYNCSKRTVEKAIVTFNSHKTSKQNTHKKIQVSHKIDSVNSATQSMDFANNVTTTQNYSESYKLKQLITNADVNVQVIPEETADKLCEDSKNSHNEQVVVKEESSDLLSPQKFCVQLRTPSPHSTSLEGRVDQNNVDVLALSLRLDSFEKRFDAVLKEVGAITSEIQHLKSDVKEMKESLGSKSTYSPKKGKDGLMQTTLSFNPSFHDESTPRLTPSKRKATDSETSEPLNRLSKRRRSKSNSSEGDSDSSDDSLSNIKVEAHSFIVDKDDYVAVYTDGCALSNGQGDAKAGIGIWFGVEHPLNLGRAVTGPPTNNTAEIQAARVAMQRAIKSGIKKLKIHTDSEFLINCATKWIYRWKKNGWLAQTGKPVKNRKELEKLDKVASKLKVRWEKVLAHSNVTGNEAADRLAKLGAENYKRCQPRSHQS